MRWSVIRFLFHHTIDRGGQIHPLHLISVNPSLSQPEQREKRKEVITSERRSSFLSGLLDTLLHLSVRFLANTKLSSRCTLHAMAQSWDQWNAYLSTCVL